MIVKKISVKGDNKRTARTNECTRAVRVVEERRKEEEKPLFDKKKVPER